MEVGATSERKVGARPGRPSVLDWPLVGAATDLWLSASQKLASKERERERAGCWLLAKGNKRASLLSQRYSSLAPRTTSSGGKVEQAQQQARRLGQLGALGARLGWACSIARKGRLPRPASSLASQPDPLASRRAGRRVCVRASADCCARTPQNLQRQAASGKWR